MIYIENYILNPFRLNKKKKLGWFYLWIKKSEYIAGYYENIKGKYKKIDESINYYLCMIDVAIYFLKDYSNYYDYVYIQHNIIINDSLFVREDVKERDFSEYLKYLFYNKTDINYIYKLIDDNSRGFNYYLVIARLLFPSYYLYYFERVVMYDLDYDKLCMIVDNSKFYESYLKKIVDRMNKYLIKKIVLPF